MNALFAQWLSSSMQYIDIQNRTDPSHQMNTVVMRGDCGSSYCQEAIVKSTLNRSRVSFKNMNSLKISLWTTFPVDVDSPPLCIGISKRYPAMICISGAVVPSPLSWVNLWMVELLGMIYYIFIEGDDSKFRREHCETETLYDGNCHCTTR